MYRYLLLVSLFFSFDAFALGQVHYSVYLDKVDSGFVEVRVDVKGVKGDSVFYQMPLWAPGAYAQVNYGRYVKDLVAFDMGNNPIDGIRKINDNLWVFPITHKDVWFKYKVISSYKNTAYQYNSLCHIDSQYFFANSTALFGYINDEKDIRTTITYRYRESWDVHCSLPIADTGFSPLRLPQGYLAYYATFTAANYDELVDAPIMAGTNLNHRMFREGNTNYHIVLSSSGKFPMDSLEDLTKKIIKAQTDFWRDTPFEKYYFLINAPTYDKSPSDGRGALEHANSSAYLLINMPWNYIRNFYAEIISHEFFHAWNVKRIHSSKLGPFDYTKPVKTTTLWLAEGITEYYSHTLLSRYGILTGKEFEKTLGEWIARTAESRMANKYSLETISVAESYFDIEKALVLYFKGPLIGLLLDLEIRSQTKNAMSLDDVMYGLYSQAKRGIHFEDFELLNIMDSISGSSLFSVHASYIAGNDTIPITTFLEKMGLSWTSPEDINRFKGVQFLPLEDSIEYAKKYFYVKWIDSSSRYYQAGLRADDILQSVNDTSVFSLFSFYSEPLDRMLESSKPLSMQILRKKEKILLNIGEDVKKRDTLPPVNTISYSTNPTPEQLAIRKGIYGKKEGW